MPRDKRFRIAAALAAVLLLRPALGQRSGVPPSSSGGPPPGTSPGSRNPGSPQGTNSSSTNNQNNPNPVPPRPTFISGMLMMDDGSELPPNVAIQRVCGGTPRIEGYADGRGYFSLQLGSRNSEVLQDASTAGFEDPSNQSGIPPSPGGDNRPQFLNCELRADLAGYLSQTVDLGTHRMLDNPDVGTILLHRVAPTEGTSVSMTSLAAPKAAQKAFQKGIEFEKRKKLVQAQNRLQQAVDLYPRYAEAWFALGRLQAAQGQNEVARHSLEFAIHADGNYVPPYIQISLLELAAKRWPDLADVTDKAIRLDSFTYPQAFFFNAVANYNLHRIEAAEQSALRAEKLDTRHRFPEVSHLLGVILAARHQYSAAGRALRNYLTLAPHAPDADAVRSQLESIDRQSAAAPGLQP